MSFASSSWLNEPAHWGLERGRLHVVTNARTDFWRETHYGFTRDSGHFFGHEIAGPFTAQLRVFVGVDAYEEAGGAVLRDLFQGDDGGWLQDPGLLDQLVVEKLQRDAATFAAEGWKWIEVAPDFAYGHQFGLRQLRGDTVLLTADEEATRDALRAEYDQLDEEYADVEDMPDAIDRRFTEIETMLGTLEDRPVAFDPEEIARAGSFVSIDSAGALKVERGYIRPEDELPIPVGPKSDLGADGETDESTCASSSSYTLPGGSTVPGNSDDAVEPEEEDGIKPLPDRLLTELTAHRTLALRNAIGEQPEVAFLAALHALSLKLFYGYPSEDKVSRAGQRLGVSRRPWLPRPVDVRRVQCWSGAYPPEARPGDLPYLVREP